MKYLTIFLILIQQAVLGQSKVEVTTVYTGENKYVQNPYADDTFTRFCIDSITINNIIYKVDLNNSALKLDLKSLKISLGDTLNIVIYHRSICKPKILNPMSQPKVSNVKFDSLKFQKDGVLSWKAFNDSIGARPSFVVEQLRCNRWMAVAHVEQNWNIENSYTAKVNVLPGINKFRVNAYSNVSDTIIFDSGIKPVNFKVDDMNKKILFEDSVTYQIQMQNGLIYQQGNDKNIELSVLENGNYHLCYDNEIIKFAIKSKMIYYSQ